ncbi:uncharacterized protein LOC116295755 [Actinia tenebrosa]|uniref:Uncharacterized protein LOC116295755 n=1 Tax=Actinia tenebrosa TaxID=6105 RepID=A0A6P8HT13_ACTTE|nr:uncharacterized protein LOC116295755 [Actinia tenebrosa]
MSQNEHDSGLHIPREKLSKEDVTERERSPIEHAFYESFLLQSRSAIENLYASNIYWSQKHAKEVKDLNRQKMVALTSMTKEQKEMAKRMQKLQEKQDQILDEKMKQYMDAKVKRGGRIRPHSTSAMPNQMRNRPTPQRPKSAFLNPLDQSLSRSSQLSKSSQNLSDLSRLSVNQNDSISLSKSCEDLSRLDSTCGKKNKVILPAIKPKSNSSSNENLSDDDDDSAFITKMPGEQKVKQNLLSAPVGFNPERRRGSLPSAEELDRQIDLERRRDTSENEPRSPTQTKWVPKTFMPQGRALPPI